MKIPKGLNRRAKIVYSKKSMKIPKAETGELKLSTVRRV